MPVTVIVSSDVANLLRQGKSGEQGILAETAIEIELAIVDLGYELLPMHAGTSDPKLATYFKVEVPDREAAERVITSLNRISAVEAAYWKPAEELP
jgi:hypothetical protein